VEWGYHVTGTANEKFSAVQLDWQIARPHHFNVGARYSFASISLVRG